MTTKANKSRNIVDILKVYRVDTKKSRPLPSEPKADYSEIFN